MLSHADLQGAATAGAFPIESTWLHATYADRLPAILRAGLIPSCWWVAIAIGFARSRAARQRPRRELQRLARFGGSPGGRHVQPCSGNEVRSARSPERAPARPGSGLRVDHMMISGRLRLDCL